MPGIDGWQLLRQLEERHGSIPVIMFSGQADAGAAGERGASAFVGKPFDPEELLARAKALVPSRRLSAATGLRRRAGGPRRSRRGRDERDPEADAATVCGEHRVRDVDHPDQDEHRRERAEAEHEQAFRHRRREVEAA